jgi:hypothetical protein
MPRVCPVLSGQPQPHQYAKGSRCLEQIELRKYRDFRLGAFATVKRKQASCLGLSENKTSSFE